MSKGERKHNKTKKKPPKSPTKKETLLEASCIAKKSFYDNPIMSEKAQQKAPEASVQQGFHCSCFARNENLVIGGSFFIQFSLIPPLILLQLQDYQKVFQSMLMSS